MVYLRTKSAKSAQKCNKCTMYSVKLWETGRVHTVTTIEAAPIRTPPRVYLSHEGSGGQFTGSDMRCMERSFFHFSLRDPVWQQRQIRTEITYMDQTWRKIILEARSAGTVRARRDPGSIFCAGALRKRGVQHGLFRWQLFLYWNWQGYRQACVISHRHVCSVSFGSSETDGWLLRYGHFKFASLFPGQIEKSAWKYTYTIYLLHFDKLRACLCTTVHFWNYGVLKNKKCKKCTEVQ